MPIYEYVCRHCGLRFELYRGFWQSDEEIECPSCGQTSPTRQFSTFSSSTESCSTG